MALSEEAFEALVRQLEENSFNDARNAYGEKGFERWRNPRFNGAMTDADTQACVQGSCGDSIEIFLKFDGGKVSKASYVTNGCGSSALCGSFTAELSRGKTFSELGRITADDVLHAIGRFPREDKHCATIAVTALHRALDRFMVGATGRPNVDKRGNGK